MTALVESLISLLRVTALVRRLNRLNIITSKILMASWLTGSAVYSALKKMAAILNAASIMMVVGVI